MALGSAAIINAGAQNSEGWLAFVQGAIRPQSSNI